MNEDYNEGDNENYNEIELDDAVDKCPNTCIDKPEALICAKFGNGVGYHYYQSFYNDCWLDYSKCMDDNDGYKWEKVHDGECDDEEKQTYTGDLSFEDLIETFSAEDVDNSEF